MPRPLSLNSRKVLKQLGRSRKTIDELAAQTGIRKDRLAKLLWHLQKRGWIDISEELRRLPVFERLRDLPADKRLSISSHGQPPSHIINLYAAFKIGLPPKRTRARTVRGNG